MTTEVLVVLCTFPDLKKARQIGAVLVERQVAACVNLLPGVRSIFRWEGEIEESEEVLAVIKTSRDAYAALERLIVELHPYETPEVLALPAQAGTKEYLGWVVSETLGGGESRGSGG